MTPLLEIRGVSKTFHTHGLTVNACRDVDLSINEGEVVGLVGESGSGKSTLASLVLGLDPIDTGSIRIFGEDLKHLLKKDPKSFRRKVQAVFQQPLLSLDSRRSIQWSILEPLVIHGIGNKETRHERMRELLSLVGLEPSVAARLPHQLSGGQLQRVNIARALALEPKLLVCDEPVSALDVSVQAQVLNVFLDIQNRLGVAMLFISHDLAVTRHISDRIVVMYGGKLMEMGETDEVCRSPRHPYTKTLLEASSFLKRESYTALVPARDELPSRGCPFSPRCPYAQEMCRKTNTFLLPVDEERSSSCIRFHEIFDD